MASPTGPTFKIGATAVHKLGSADASGESGGRMVHIVNDASFVGTITVKGQSRALEVAGVADALVALPYRKGYLNGAVADWTFVSTAITTTSIIFIPASALDVALDVTYTSGSATVYVLPVLGSCAF